MFQSGRIILKAMAFPIRTAQFGRNQRGGDSDILQNRSFGACFGKHDYNVDESMDLIFLLTRWPQSRLKMLFFVFHMTFNDANWCLQWREWRLQFYEYFIALVPFISSLLFTAVLLLLHTFHPALQPPLCLFKLLTPWDSYHEFPFPWKKKPSFFFFFFTPQRSLSALIKRRRRGDFCLESFRLQRPFSVLIERLWSRPDIISPN